MGDNEYNTAYQLDEGLYAKSKIHPTPLGIFKQLPVVEYKAVRLLNPQLP